MLPCSPAPDPLRVCGGAAQLRPSRPGLSSPFGHAHMPRPRARAPTQARAHRHAGTQARGHTGMRARKHTGTRAHGHAGMRARGHACARAHAHGHRHVGIRMYMHMLTSHCNVVCAWPAYVPSRPRHSDGPPGVSNMIVVDQRLLPASVEACHVMCVRLAVVLSSVVNTGARLRPHDSPCVMLDAPQPMLHTLSIMWYLSVKDCPSTLITRCGCPFTRTWSLAEWMRF